MSTILHIPNGPSIDLLAVHAVGPIEPKIVDVREEPTAQRYWVYLSCTSLDVDEAACPRADLVRLWEQALDPDEIAPADPKCQTDGCGMPSEAGSKFCPAHKWMPAVESPPPPAVAPPEMTLVCVERGCREFSVTGSNRCVQHTTAPATTQ